MVLQRRHARFTRDAFLLVVGTGMLIFETVSGGDRPYLISAAVALCFGLPLALLADRVRKL